LLLVLPLLLPPLKSWATAAAAAATAAAAAAAAAATTGKPLSMHAAYCTSRCQTLLVAK
jgi:hypothetical protein